MPNGSSQIAPLVAEGFLQQLNSRNYDANLVIQNAGGVRIDVPKGDITIETAYTLLPFANTLYVLELTGAEVKQVLEDDKMYKVGTNSFIASGREGYHR